MKKKYFNIKLSFLMILFFSISSYGQNGNSLWTKTTKDKALTGEQVARRSQPNKAVFFELNIDALKLVLQNAPERELSTESSLVINFPNANGKLEGFKVMEASVMHPTLQANYSELRSYVAQSIENPSALMRFSVTPMGLHAMTLSTETGTQLIDPYTTNGIYIVYSKRDLPAIEAPFECGVEGESFIDEADFDFDITLARNANDGTMRTYDLAMGSSAAYTNFHGGTVANALAAMMVTVTRVSGIYERDLSIRFQLVANNNLLISTDANQIFTNSGSFGAATGIINGIIGFGTYDIGHVVTTGSGGIAGFGVVCGGFKGRGTTGLNSPTGDTFDVDYVAHEIGHQFGGNHTFNGSSGSCTGGNRNGGTAYEPGSGSTIMAYAGICSPQNVQNNSNDYFHRLSIIEIWNFVNTGGGSSCPTASATGNSAPSAEAGDSYDIPISTPYKLTGSSTDTPVVNADAHTYTWEQFDLGPAGVPANSTFTGPMVRSFEGTTSPVRYIPRLEDVLSNGGISTTWEKLASVGRLHTFELTVRDNDPNGGQTASDNMTVTTSDSAGPFVVTSQSTNEVWDIGSSQTITWDVANTTAAPVSAANVNILLSIDGGSTFPTVLASNVSNDGSHDITVPSGTVTSTARLIVEGAENIFYNVNTIDFTIQNSLSIDENTLDNFSIFPNPNTGAFTVKFSSNTGENTAISIYDIRGRNVFNEIYEAVGDFNETIRLNTAQAGMYLINISDGINTITKKIIIE